MPHRENFKRTDSEKGVIILEIPLGDKHLIDKIIYHQSFKNEPYDPHEIFSKQIIIKN